MNLLLLVSDYGDFSKTMLKTLAFYLDCNIINLMMTNKKLYYLDDKIIKLPQNWNDNLVNRLLPLMINSSCWRNMIDSSKVSSITLNNKSKFYWLKTIMNTLPRLNSITIDGNAEINFYFSFYLKLNNITFLNLINVSELFAIYIIKSLKNVNTLIIQSCNLNKWTYRECSYSWPDEISFISTINELKLISLKLINCNINDNFLEKLIRNQPLLNHINLSNNNITNQGLEILLNKCKNLENITIKDNNINNYYMNSFKTYYPQINFIY